MKNLIVLFASLLFFLVYNLPISIFKDSIQQSLGDTYHNLEGSVWDFKFSIGGKRLNQQDFVVAGGLEFLELLFFNPTVYFELLHKDNGPKLGSAKLVLSDNKIITTKMSLNAKQIKSLAKFFAIDLGFVNDKLTLNTYFEELRFVRPASVKKNNDTTKNKISSQKGVHFVDQLPINIKLGKVIVRNIDIAGVKIKKVAVDVQSRNNKEIMLDIKKFKDGNTIINGILSLTRNKISGEIVALGNNEPGWLYLLGAKTTKSGNKTTLRIDSIVSLF